MDGRMGDGDDGDDDDDEMMMMMMMMMMNKQKQTKNRNANSKSNNLAASKQRTKQIHTCKTTTNITYVFSHSARKNIKIK